MWKLWLSLCVGKRKTLELMSYFTNSWPPLINGKVGMGSITGWLQVQWVAHGGLVYAIRSALATGLSWGYFTVVLVGLERVKMCSAQWALTSPCYVMCRWMEVESWRQKRKCWCRRLAGCVGALEPTCFIWIKEKGHLGNVLKKKTSYLVLTPWDRLILPVYIKA